MSRSLQPFEFQLHSVDGNGMTVRQQMRRMLGAEKACGPRDVKQLPLGSCPLRISTAVAASQKTTPAARAVRKVIGFLVMSRITAG
jgi:hypothetical protein